jgi:hypothetical protein
MQHLPCSICHAALQGQVQQQHNCTMFHGINLTLDESAPAISESPQPPAKRMRPNPPTGAAFGGSAFGGSALGGGGEPKASGGEEAPPQCKCGIPTKRCVAGPNAKPETRGRAFWA